MIKVINYTDEYYIPEKDIKAVYKSNDRYFCKIYDTYEISKETYNYLIRTL